VAPEKKPKIKVAKKEVAGKEAKQVAIQRTP